MYNKSAHAIREGFLKGELTASQITEYFLSRVQLFDPQIQSFLNVLSERMMEQAVNLDIKKAKGKPVGLLAGIPIAIKDNIHINGENTTCASKFLSNYKAFFRQKVGTRTPIANPPFVVHYSTTLQIFILWFYFGFPLHPHFVRRCRRRGISLAALQ